MHLPAVDPRVCRTATGASPRCHKEAETKLVWRTLQDASDEFNAIHSSKAKAQLDDFLLGELTTDGIPPAGTNLRSMHAALNWLPSK